VTATLFDLARHRQQDKSLVSRRRPYRVKFGVDKPRAAPLPSALALGISL
jgi:hypothetical protein